MSIIVHAAVEGITDEAVARRLVVHVGAQVGGVYGKNGKTALRLSIDGYNNGARFDPWFVIVDLDRDADCAPPLRNVWLPHPAPLMCFRIAVRGVESWLLADRERIASFLGVSRARLPSNPEGLGDPKRAMVDLARRSRRNAIKDDMVPRPGSGRAVGPAYASRLIEFASGPWRPDVAADRCDSLRRALECLQRLLDETLGGTDD